MTHVSRVAGARETKTGRTKLFETAFFKSLGNDREFCTKSGKKQFLTESVSESNF